MLEEMGARDQKTDNVEVHYENFVAWWLSDSKVAAKVRAAKKQDEGVAHQLFMRLVSKDSASGIRIQDVMDKWKMVFGVVLSKLDAHDVMKECNDGDVEESHVISEEELDTWWRSSLPLAQVYRGKRLEDMKVVRAIYYLILI